MGVALMFPVLNTTINMFFSNSKLLLRMWPDGVP